MQICYALGIAAADGRVFKKATQKKNGATNVSLNCDVRIIVSCFVDRGIAKRTYKYLSNYTLDEISLTPSLPQ